MSSDIFIMPNLVSFLQNPTPGSCQLIKKKNKTKQKHHCQPRWMTDHWRQL